MFDLISEMKSGKYKLVTTFKSVTLNIYTIIHLKLKKKHVKLKIQYIFKISENNFNYLKNTKKNLFIKITKFRTIIITYLLFTKIRSTSSSGKRKMFTKLLKHSHI